MYHKYKNKAIFSKYFRQSIIILTLFVSVFASEESTHDRILVSLFYLIILPTQLNIFYSKETQRMAQSKAQRQKTCGKLC